MKMRELEKRTGVDREVIRILLREGLLPEPARPSRNRAEYCEDHVRSIAAIRQLQREARLTLREIRAALDGERFDRPASGAPYAHLEQLLSDRLGMVSPSLVPVKMLLDRFPEAERDARAFENMGMLTVTETVEGAALTQSEARLVEIWGKIREAGFVEESGFPPENVAFYLEAARLIAHNEAEIFFKHGKTPLSEDSAATMLHVALPLMLEFVGLLRNAAFMKELRIHTGDQ